MLLLFRYSFKFFANVGTGRLKTCLPQAYSTKENNEILIVSMYTDLDTILLVFLVSCFLERTFLTYICVEEVCFPHLFTLSLKFNVCLFMSCYS